MDTNTSILDNEHEYIFIRQMSIQVFIRQLSKHMSLQGNVYEYVFTRQLSKHMSLQGNEHEYVYTRQTSIHISLPDKRETAFFSAKHWAKGSNPVSWNDSLISSGVSNCSIAKDVKPCSCKTATVWSVSLCLAAH